MLINWALHQLPSTEKLAAEVQKDPESMVLHIPRCVLVSGIPKPQSQTCVNAAWVHCRALATSRPLEYVG